MKKFSLYLLSLVLLTLSCEPKEEAKTEVKKSESKKEVSEWIDLSAMDAWRGYNMDRLPSNWKIENGIIECFGEAGDEGGDIISKQRFDNFEFVFEWKLSAEGNSGVMYHAIEDDLYHSPYQTGPEVQIIDDLGFPEPLEAWQKTAADYNMYDPDPNKELKAIGKWNEMKIIFNNKHVEYWLNGKKTVEFEAWSDDWYNRKAKSKWAKMPHWGMSGSGHLGLQDHGAGVWFRNLKVRML